MKKICILLFSFFCFFSVNADEEIINLIENKLEEIGVKTQRNNLKWGDNSIRKILQNMSKNGIHSVD